MYQFFAIINNEPNQGYKFKFKSSKQLGIGGLPSKLQMICIPCSSRCANDNVALPVTIILFYFIFFVFSEIIYVHVVNVVVYRW